MKLKDRVAIVTGGANGIGRAIALNLAKEGARIVIADIDSDGGKKMVDEIKALNSRAIATETDVTKSSEVEQMVKAALSEFGVIDILVNNAGGGAREKRTLFSEEAEEMTDIIIARNLKGVLNCSRAVINHMMERRSGKIVNIASICGVNGVPKEVTFSAAKAGVIMFTRALAMEVASYGINVNCVSPGGIDTALAAKSRSSMPSRPPEFKMGKPEDVANVLTFLSSDEASFINGQNYVVSGITGMMALREED